jgi:type I restriction enzyme S subunit
MQQLLTKGIGHTKFKDSELGEIPESWEVMNLGSLVDKVGSGITPKGGQETYLKEGILFIRSQNVLYGKLKLSDVAYISKEQNEKMQGSQIATGDVLLNITGASIGRSCVVPDNITEGIVNQHVCIIRTKKQLNNSFLCQLLNSNYGQNQIDKFQTGGNREGLNFQQIRSFDIPFPPLNEQNKIADILSTMDEKLESLHAKKENFQELKRGLMQKLLIGKIRVKFN